MQVTEQPTVSQAHIAGIQDLLSTCDDVIEGETVHYFAPGVYVRVLKIPAGNFAVGKAHRTQHVTMLIKGEATITDATGVQHNVHAPFICVSDPGKKFVYCHTDCEFVNVHPTETQDLEAIEAAVIIPEAEYRASIGLNQGELECHSEQ